MDTITERSSNDTPGLGLAGDKAPAPDPPGGGLPPPPPPGAEPPSPPPSSPPSPPPSPPPGTGEPRLLRRDPHGRILGGVAAGIAHYIGVDVAVVRIAFVALVLLGGFGLLLYLAGWLLIPEAESQRTIAHDFLDRRPRRRNLAVVVAGVVLAIVALSDLFSSGPWWPHWNYGFGFFLSLLALAMAAVLVAGSGANRSAASRLGWIVVTLLVTLAAIAAVVAATLFSVESLSGVPLSGGIGDSQWRPTTAAQVHSRYRLAAGNLIVDLRGVDFAPGTRHITASVGIGHLLVELPDGPTVSVTAHSGLGDVQVFGQSLGSGFGSVRTTRTAAATSGYPAESSHLVLDAETGVGQVQVVRAAS